jgi:hypothetical protein
MLVLSGCTTGSGGPASAETPPDADLAGEVSTPVPFHALRRGMCFNDEALLDAREAVDTVACSDPHLYEVFSVVTVPGAAGAPYPGREPLRALVRDRCFTELDKQFHGQPLQIGLGVSLMVSFQESDWRSGVRRAVCGVFPLSQRPRTGSVLGT